MRGNEKNWMSVPDKPFKFITATSTNGAKSTDMKYNVSAEICDFNSEDLYGGSTNLLKDNSRNGYYSISHRYFHGERGRRTYANHLVKYDENLKPISISNQFKFSEYPIEFVTVMLELPNDELLIGVTEMDEHPLLYVFDKENIVSIC